MRDMRKWLNAEFISALDLLKDDGSGYKSLDVVIARVHSPAMVQCGPKKEKLAVLSFQKAQKRMILRDSHMKGLIKILGPDADKMKGKKVRLWVEEDVKAFGDVFDCVRFKAAPGNGRRSLMPSHQDPTARIEPGVAASKSPPESDLPPDYEDPLTTEEEAELAAAVKAEEPTWQQEITS